MHRPVPSLSLLFLLTVFGTAQAQEKSFAYQVAPQECLFFSSWTGFPPIPEGSANSAELMLAEPEILEFGEALIERFEAVAGLVMQDRPPAKRQAMQEIVAPVFRMLFARPGCFLVESVEILDEEGRFTADAGVVFDFGEGVEVFLAAITDLAESDGMQFKPGPRVSGADTLQVVIADASLQSSVSLAAVNGKLIVGIGQATERLISAAKAPRKTARPEWLKELEEQLPVPRRTSVGYVNLAAMLQQLRESAEPPGAGLDEMNFQLLMVTGLIEQLGLGNLESLTTSTGYDDTGLVDHTRLSWSGPATGLLDMLRTEPLNRKSLANIPSDALFAASLSLNLSDLLTKSLGIVDRMEPVVAEQMRDGLSSMTAQTGIDPQRDILAHMGATWTIFNGAGDGFGVGTLITVDLKDETAFSESMGQLLVLLRSMGLRDDISKRKADETAIYTLNFPDTPNPAQISWAIHDGHLWFSLFPQVLRPYLDGSDAVERLDLDTLAIEDGMVGYGYQDVKRQYELLYCLSAAYVGTLLTISQSPEFVEDGEEILQILSSIPLPSLRSMYRHLQPSQMILNSDSQGWQLTTKQTAPAINVVVAAPVAVGFLLPAVVAARAAGRRMESMNHLREIAIAVHNYESTWGRMPAAYSMNKKGKPLLSWRVQLLPFLGHTDLYNSFYLDEPWDSEHNIQLLEQMPEVYSCPGGTTKQGMTSYLGNGGKHGMLAFEAGKKKSEKSGKKGVTFASVRDGLSNTILVVEGSADLAEPWTKPTEYEFAPDKAFRLFGTHTAGTIAALGDGSIRFLEEELDRSELKALFTRDRGDGKALNDLLR